MRKTGKRLGALLLLTSLLAGCGKQPIEAPELIGFVGKNETIRPVEYRDIMGNTQYCGVVTPTEYPYFWLTDSYVEEVYVKVGDYVEEGQVLAKTRLKEVEREVKELQKEKTYLEQLLELDKESYQYDHYDMEYALASANETKDKTLIDSVLQDIQYLEENERYEEELQAFRIGQLTKKIAEKQKLLKAGTLTATKAGYVTYVKDIATTNFLPKTENVVVISDYEERYIELPIRNIDEDRGRLEEATYIFSRLGEETWELEYWPYLSEEKSIMKNKECYRPCRFVVKGEKELPKVGTFMPVFTRTDVEEQVLAVGKDSIYSDATGDFVYVKKGDNKELRYITVGRSSGYYTEVIDGLEEGELVTYASNNLAPVSYQGQVLENENYELYGDVQSYTFGEEEVHSTYSDYTGFVAAVLKENGDMVEEGEPILTIRTSASAATLKSLQDEINALETQYLLQQETYTKQVNDLEATRLNIPDPLEPENDKGATRLDPKELGVDPFWNKKLDARLKKMEVGQKIARVNYEYSMTNLQQSLKEAKKHNDGTGEIQILAAHSGMLKECKIKEGDAIYPNQKLFAVTDKSKQQLLLYSFNSLMVNQRVRFSSENSESEYTGTIVGYKQDGRSYFSEKEKHTYLTCGETPPNEKLTYIVKMDNEAFFQEDATFKAQYVALVYFDAFRVPFRGLFDETIEADTLFYLWQKVGENLVKRQVHLAPYDTVVQGPLVHMKKQDQMEVIVLDGIMAGQEIVVRSE